MPFFTAADGAELHYTDEGHGRALICLAGLTRNGSDFDYLAPHLPPLRLIRPDYRGRGRSQWTGAATYTVMQEGADVLALLDHLGLEQAAILGTSRGGLIGMYLAVIAKDRLRGLFLNDIGPVIEPEGLDRIDAYIGRNPAARSHGEAAMALARAMPEFDVPASRWAEEARKHFIKTDQGLQINYDPALRDAYLAARAGGAGDLWPMFAACEGLPLAVIRGADSALLSATTLAEMTRLRPDMVVEEVPGRGHVPFLDEAESLRAINTWLGMCL
ncbi:MAG: putative hydrolases or acyltransferases (alpha/beta hydrolase superfamily) [Roseibaca calidilacus]|uniref:Pimeloyl-ACP methyl ester carboxylesterase n=1 Tax=Roseibaca calidilacus TaxID=1666912 RepID=A0A0P8AIJ0_9RHOB|nr:alpha/beta hydrolase [Roseibaca calidilacus]KPP94202.1 MAG: putative hydrolases or acyltransferases (alpha/beta hydrolase superfamily) [Roseibaca calidilacus]CUX81382.1 Pimeloyl-ACP methyl ester carboxylesterase [Roseibaca calidilacus]